MTTKSFELDVLLGFANVIADNADATVPLYIDLDKDGNPKAGGVPLGSTHVFIDQWPEEQNSVTLLDYPVSDDPSLSDSVIGVQVTIWHRDRDRLRSIVSDVFNLMQGRWGGNMGNVRLVQAVRRSGANLGQDGNGRVGRTENYYLTVHRLSTHRQ